MRLYNCESKEELKLKEIELPGLTNNELLELAEEIKVQFRDAVLKDENIVVDAFLEITKELGKRLLI